MGVGPGIVEGLILSATIPLVVTPPDPVLELDDDDTWKLL